MNKSPLQLISIDPKTKKLVLCSQAAAIIASFPHKPFAVLCVVGKYRTGKSYLINQVLLNQKQGFEVGSTINACTKGLWMWPELIQFESQKSKDAVPVLLIDTEGIGSVEEDTNHDVKVFLLAMLMSSYFIYNSVGTIDDLALQNLGLIVNLTKLLQKGDESAQRDLFATFPQFLWVLRDFTLRLEDSFGNKISPKEYLESALKPLKGITETIENKNKIRRHITQFFPERDCITMVRPTQDEKDLQRLSEIEFTELREEFQEQVTLLRKKLGYKMSVKQYKGKPATPFSFLEMCKYFVAAINDGNLPVIENQWQMIQQQEMENYIKLGRNMYMEEINKAISHEIVSEEELEEVNQLLIKKVKLYLEENTESELFKGRWKQIKKDLLRLYEEAQRKLELKHGTQVEQLKNHFLQEIQSYDREDFWGIVDIANEAASTFWQRKARPSEFKYFVISIWEQTVQRIQQEFQIVKSLSNLHVQIQTKQETEIRKLQEQLERATASKLEESLQRDQLIEKLKQQVQRLEGKLKEANFEQTTRENDWDQRNSQLQMQLKQQTTAHKKELLEFQSQANQLKEKLVQSNIQIEKISKLIVEQEQIIRKEQIDSKAKFEKLKQQIESNEAAVTQYSSVENMGVQPVRKHKSVNAEILKELNHKWENNLSEWRYQKDYLQKQLQEAYAAIQQQKQQNEEIINSLRQH